MMSNEPPQGAQSADPVRELLDNLRDAATEAVNATAAANRPQPAPGERRYEVEAHGALTIAINAVESALRTALAAPEGPAPTKQVALWQYRWANPGGYPNQPASMLEWDTVSPAISNQTLEQRLEELRAFRYQGKLAYEVRALYAHPTPEAPPPVEARQPHNPWRASIENILTGDNYFRAAEWHELLADLDRLYAMPPAVKPLDDPRLQQAFGDAIEGALAFGYQQNNKPPVGHWLNRFWNIGSAEAEKASKPPIVTDEMVTAYLKANDEYWRKVDEIAPPIGVWRNGTPREATRESLRAALAAPAGAIQPHLDHQVGAQVTPLPLDSAGGAASATAERCFDNGCAGCDDCIDEQDDPE